jgi:hypothetical protein
MGAINDEATFTLQPGQKLDDAIHDLFERERWEHGHGGYSGTLAEKSRYVLVGQCADATEEELGLAEAMIQASAEYGEAQVARCREHASSVS